YFGGRLEDASALDSTRWRAGLDLAALVAGLRAQVGAFDYSTALQRIWRDIIDAANRYIQETEPFKLAKTDLQACRGVLVNLAEAIRVSPFPIKPFLPRTAQAFYQAFNFGDARAWDEVSYNDADKRLLPAELRVTAATKGGKPAPLFP